MTRTAVAAAVAMAVAFSACGGSESDEPAAPATTTSSAPPVQTQAEPPFDPEAAAEAAPEAEAEGGAEASELPAGDEEAVRAATEAYISALNRGDAEAVCALLEPGALPLSELPVNRGGCGPSLAASIGHRRPGGVPAWRRTEIVEVSAVSVGGDRARVTATVTHRFADRKYTSIEEDVIYLDRDGGRWLIAKPSATLYRAVGYPEPPLRAFTPPAD
jgi:ketosteroid isomerase-like protein